MGGIIAWWSWGWLVGRGDFFCHRDAEKGTERRKGRECLTQRREDAKKRKEKRR